MDNKENNKKKQVPLRKTFPTQDVFDAINYVVTDTLKLHKEFDWVEEGKYSTCAYILKDTTTGKFYWAYDSRSGSYFSDYYYDSEDWDKEGTMDLQEAEEREVTKVRWCGVLVDVTD
jgi:hypothetical protein